VTDGPDQTQKDVPAPRGRSRRRLAFALAGLAGALCLAFALNRLVTLDAVLVRYEGLRAAVEHNRAGALAMFMLAYAGAVTLSLPGASLFTLLGGLLFGWLLGGFATVVAATSGAILVFLIARTALGSLLAGRAGPRLQKLLEALRADAAYYLLFCRLAPVFPFWMVNLAAALLPTPLRIFAVTTAIGIVPASFAMASAGASLAEVVGKRKHAYEACVAAGRAACSYDIGVRHVLTPGILLSLGALGLLALLPVILRRTGIMRHWRREPPPPGDPA
jgi:uncharacterized membrane protein YdjX (TVP38/TMEM64 family)